MLGPRQTNETALVRRVASGPLLVDLLAAVPVTLLWLQLFALGDPSVAALSCAGLFLVRVLAWLAHAQRSLAPVPAPSVANEQRLQLAADSLQSFPRRHALVYASSWVAYLLASAAAVSVGQGELAVAGVFALGVLIGVSALASMHAEARLEAAVLELLARLPARGSGSSAAGGAAGQRLSWRAWSIAIGPLLVVGALAWHTDLELLRLGGRGLGIAWLAVLLALGAWSWLAAVQLQRRFNAPIDRIRSTVARVLDGDDLTQVAAILVVDEDELGALAHDLNTWIESLQQVVVAAETIAKGRLDVEFVGDGQLPAALGRMVELVSDVILQIRMMAIQLTATAAQIELAAQVQARSSEQQAEGMRRIAETMASLTRSAAQISSAVQNVFDNAESTLATTDELAATFAELDRRNQGIGELLEVIREIANRSDLLSLNGALEATRVGHAGAGFALIAEEMRRLAERVTRTVVDVRKLVTDIAEDSSTTVDLTELGRTLAEGTSIAAREISGETKRQTSETGSASRAVSDLADYVMETGASALHTEQSAEELKFQAQQLEVLTRGFQLRGHAGASEARVSEPETDSR